MDRILYLKGESRQLCLRPTGRRSRSWRSWSTSSRRTSTDRARRSGRRSRMLRRISSETFSGNRWLPIPKFSRVESWVIIITQLCIKHDRLFLNMNNCNGNIEKLTDFMTK